MSRPVTVSRGAYGDHDIIVVTVTDAGYVGRGECCALAHYGLSAKQTIAEIEGAAKALPAQSTREDLLALLPPGPARNGIDCAMWDLESKRKGKSVWALAELTQPARVDTAVTVVLSTPEDMAEQALRWSAHSTLKLKLGGNDAAACLRAVRAARPDAHLAVDANEAWRPEQFMALWPVLEETGVMLIEQPLRSGEDISMPRQGAPAPICADESFHSLRDLELVKGRYDYINIKLDKCGGLTEALRIVEAAPRYGLRCMVGCMFATSLAIAPALVVASVCDFADLDGPLHITNDRAGGFRVTSGAYETNSSQLWGRPE